MATDYNVGEKVILKDGGQVYKIIGVRIDDHVVLYDLEKDGQKRKRPPKLTVMRSAIEAEKIYTPKYAQTAVYKAKYFPRKSGSF